MSSLPPVRGPRGNKVAPIVAAPPRLNAGDAGEAASEEDDESHGNFEFDDRFQELFISPELYLHMTTVMALINLMILMVGLLSDRMIVGVNSVAGGEETATGGMWKVYYGNGESYALCSGWPDGNSEHGVGSTGSFCQSVNASRVLFILAIVGCLIAAVCGLVHWIGGPHYNFLSEEQMMTYIASGIFGLVGWIVWMANVDKEMNSMLKASMVDEAAARGIYLCVPSEEQGYTIGNCPESSIYPYFTLGYSYGFLAWAALFPLMLILSKAFLPRLDIKHVESDKRIIWLCGYMFDASNKAE